VRCDRSEEDPELSYAEEEVVVESAAFTVCGAVGLDTSGFSVPYLTGWSEHADGAEAIQRYAALIDRLAGRLEDAALGAEVALGPIATQPRQHDLAFG
jgi:antirestriction protein ArdC